MENYKSPERSAWFSLLWIRRRHKAKIVPHRVLVQAETDYLNGDYRAVTGVSLVATMISKLPKEKRATFVWGVE